MVRAPWSTVGAERGWKLPVGALLLGLSVTRAAHGDVSLIPGTEGGLGAWLVAQAPSEAAARPLEPSAGALANPGGSARWRLASGRAGAALALDQLFGGRSGTSAWLGGVLELSQPLDGWLLLSIDGEVQVFVDGAPLWSASGPHRRGLAWDVIPLQLPAGAHPLIVRVTQRALPWNAQLRLLARQDLRPPLGARLRLPGVEPAEGPRLLQTLVAARASAGVSARGYAPSVQVEFPGGLPLTEPLPISYRLEGGPPRSAGTLNGEAARALPLVITLSPTGAAPPREPRRRQLELRLGAVPLQLGWVESDAPAVLTRLEAPRPPSPSRALTEIRETTLAWRARELVRASDTGRPDAVTAALRSAEQSLTRLLADDWATRPGLVELAARPIAEGSPDPWLLHVPEGISSQERRWPLVIVLHGLNGTPRSVMRAFLDGAGDAAQLPGFVLAPHAYGNSFYRGVGEQAVMAAVDWALAALPIDPQRVSVTGVSMGGTGAAHLALRYPQRFAATAPLCGYHSWFIRRDTSGRSLASWEAAAMAHWSPASWAAAGRDQPLYLAQGTQDHPLDNGKVLLEAYAKEGYPFTAEWPDIGHNVQDVVWRGRRQWPWLARARLAEAPDVITLHTDSLRYAQRGWVRLLAAERPGDFSRIDAERLASGELRLRTRNVAALELLRGPPPLLPPEELRVSVDGAALSFGASERVALQREGDAWRSGAPAPDARPLGPALDALLERPRFVWGSGDPRTAAANREVARLLAARWTAELEPPLIMDRELTPRDDDTSLVLVGSVDDHAVLGPLRGRLPIEASAGALRYGDVTTRQPGSGAVFIARDPRRPSRHLLVVTAAGAPGLWRALSLPTLLPDFLVYDERLRRATQEQLLSGAPVLAGGYFDRRGALGAAP